MNKIYILFPTVSTRIFLIKFKILFVLSGQTLMQGCIKFLTPTPGGGVIKSFGEEFQVVKMGRDFKGFWGKYHVEKRVRRSNIICSVTLRM